MNFTQKRFREMADKDQKPLDDDALLSRVEKLVNFGVGFCDSKLSKERERVIKHYNLTLPLKQSTGRSSYARLRRLRQRRGDEGAAAGDLQR
jgi:hypothetical protein